MQNTDDEICTILQMTCCDIETGEVWFVKAPPRECFTCDGGWRRFIANHAGRRAFNAPHCLGYRAGSLRNKKYLAHRIVWVHAHGDWPKGEIDHVNGDKTDNRIKNLRDVSSSENKKNVRLISTNSSGHVGVYWTARERRWVAQIVHLGRNRCLGYYRTIEDAIAARERAQVEFGYHPNHGRERSFSNSARQN